MFEERIKSKNLGNERSIWLRKPESGAEANNLVVFLDAERYLDRMDALPMIDELRGQIANSWFVFVSEESPEARWRECPCYPPFSKFIGEELLPWLAEKFAVPERRVLAGLSYTGLAAAFVAKEYPGVFQKVISQSGSFWWNSCWLVEEFRKLQEKLPVEFFLDVGTREIHENVQHREDVLQVMSQIEGVRRFRDALHALGHSVRYEEFDGDHDYTGFRQTLPSALKWAIPGQLIHEGEGSGRKSASMS
ncbi:MAG: alpha/beta hydrolase-fold protein [Pseudomonadota bacterium]